MRACVNHVRCSRNVLCVPKAKRADFLSARPWADWVNTTEIIV